KSRARAFICWRCDGGPYVDSIKTFQTKTHNHRGWIAALGRGLSQLLAVKTSKARQSNFLGNAPRRKDVQCFFQCGASFSLFAADPNPRDDRQRQEDGKRRSDERPTRNEIFGSGP